MATLPSGVRSPASSFPLHIRILDGGMGDEIYKQLLKKESGVDANEREWSAPGLLDETNHHLVYDLHLQFLQAGRADVITTCNFSVRQQNGFSDAQVRFACDAAGRLAREAVKATAGHDSSVAMVAGSLPPLLECFRQGPVTGRLRPESEYWSMIESLAPFCDLFLGETLSSTAEAEQVLDAVQLKCPEKPCWVSFSITKTGTLYSGESASQAIGKLLSVTDDISATHRIRPSAILFNCSSPEAITIALENISHNEGCRDLLKSSRCELGVYPNRYRPVTQDWETLAQAPRGELTPERLVEFARYCAQNHGVTLIGGCCGISVEYIRALSTALKGLGSTIPSSGASSS